ncbi:hypothetical protein ACFVZC_01920 [Streptomyces marokkonensis]|uniref:Uncharacterized protein n=1 Tax=Streptomyces marokkonensis TaxID=324855 RepID=A0ABW6PZ17_9ACTN
MASAQHRPTAQPGHAASPGPEGHSAPPGGPAAGASAEPDGLRFRSGRASWPDVRTHAFAVPPAEPRTEPRTADEFLAVGDPGAAVKRYAEELEREPRNPHPLAGRIVARAALEPARAPGGCRPGRSRCRRGRAPGDRRGTADRPE